MSRFLYAIYISTLLFLSTGNAVAEDSSFMGTEIPPDFFGAWDVYAQSSPSENVIGQLIFSKNSYVFKTELESSSLDKYINAYLPVPPFIEERQGRIVLENWPMIVLGEASGSLSYRVRIEKKGGIMRLEPQFSVMQNPYIVKYTK